MPNPAEQPRFDQPVVDNQGRITRPWMDYLLRMASAQGQVDLSALTNALEQRLSAIESQQSGGFGITGNQPITVAGVPQPGHVVSIGLADLPDSGKGAALVKITRDAKGRVSGTQAATTDDLAEGGTHLYYTDARARAAAHLSFPMILQTGASPIPITTDRKLPFLLANGTASNIPVLP